MNTLLLLLRRSFAFLYDALLLVALYFLVTALLLTLTDGEAIQHPAYYGLLWLIGGAFFTGFWRRGGQTLGMRAWQLRLIDEGDEGTRGASHPDAVHERNTVVARLPRPTLTRLWTRYLVGTLLFGVGFLFALFDRHGRTANDRLSGTAIIKDSEYLKKKA